jgi:hypothetical protein
MANRANQYVGILQAVEIWVRTFSLSLTLPGKNFTFQIKFILKILRVDASSISIHSLMTSLLKKVLMSFLGKFLFGTIIQSTIYPAIKLASMFQLGL